jgi:hypothetical protein
MASLETAAPIAHVQGLERVPASECMIRALTRPIAKVKRRRKMSMTKT